ncbi:DUF896 domain-containing protein [Clostridium sp. Marseille-P299]|uniref:DUF896 domain-containing protein n=1 Tax=Clostridium sp. Marseille-P299 TaxID=1805477 RepID=UPI000835117F|nr:DUF896 domain-containing protein [Clostridium sp. Marseille-P299]
MDEKTIARINELYHKSQNEGLTEEEKKEQRKLRADYIAAIRANMRGTLNNISILNEDGSITELAKKDKTQQ